MWKLRSENSALWCSAALLLLVSGGPTHAGPEPRGGHEVLDDRYHHDRFYPLGLRISVLPPSYTTVWIGGVPFYYADDVYYRWVPQANEYEVVEPPAAADQPGKPAGAPTEDFYVYPKNGQTPEQQSADRFECYTWSKRQTGFDPTQAGGGVAPDQAAHKREEYRRALTACLEGRGYSVK